MDFDFLNKYEPKIVNGLLAAAVLAQGSTSEELSEETTSVLIQVRQLLNIAPDDFSPLARATVERALSDAIKKNVLPGRSAEEALSRAGQAGRLPPDFYAVETPKEFLHQF